MPSKTKPGTKPNATKKRGKYKGKPSRFYNPVTKEWSRTPLSKLS